MFNQFKDNPEEFIIQVGNIGDYVVFPSKVDRMVNIGVVEGEYIYTDSEKEYVQQRKVKWLNRFLRISFTRGVLSEMR